jgi:two-component system response regulator YesN
MVTLQGNTVLDEIISYMEAHTGDNISLEDAAKLVHKSPSTISHLFHNALGKSFKQTLIETKLRKAESYIENDPDITISDAAARVGYDDPLYFSRIYRKYRGVSPREFQKNCRRKT